MRLPGACHVHFVRSALAHARIAAIDVSAALEAPGVIAVFTGADLADMPVPPPPMAGMINAEMGQPLLAAGVVRYVGEPVAAVVTEERYQGEDAGDLVDVDYDVLTPVIDMTTAADDAAPVLFPAAGTNVAASFGDRAALSADLFDGCDVVISRTIVNQRVAPAPMETRAAAAAWSADGRLTAWIPSQGAQGTRKNLAEMLGMDQAGMRVITPDVGGAFGGPRAGAVATSVVTKTRPVGAYRGAERPEATSAVARAIDLFAAEIGMDPAEVRRKYLLPRFAEPHTTTFGAVYDSGDYPAA